MKKPENVKLTEEQVESLCEYLTGTMYSMEEGLSQVFPDIDYDTLDRETLELIDDKIFNCDECGWWYDTDELGENDTCTDCEETADEENE